MGLLIEFSPLVQ